MNRVMEGTHTSTPAGSSFIECSALLSIGKALMRTVRGAQNNEAHRPRDKMGVSKATHGKVRRAHLHLGVLFGLLTEAESVRQSSGSVFEGLPVTVLCPN